MSDSIQDILEEIEQLRMEIEKYREEISTIRTNLAKARHIETFEKRKGTYSESSEIYEVIENYLNNLDEKDTLIKDKKAVLNKKLQELSTINLPEQIIKQCSNKVPFFMLPVRLETKYMCLNTDRPQLWVRIYPDDIAIDTHEESFTEEEVDKAKFYFNEVKRAEEKQKELKSQLKDEVGEEKLDVILELGEETFLSGIDLTEVVPEGFNNIDDGIDYWQQFRKLRETIKIPAWMELVNSFGPFRSAYIVHNEEFFSSDDIPLRQESWSRSPQTYVMPDYFTIRLYRKKIVDGEIIHEPWVNEDGKSDHNGKLISYPLAVGPDPLSEDDDPNQLFFDVNSEWMIDFDKAVEIGMGIKINLKDLSKEEIKQGFSRIIAIGIKTPKDEDGHVDILKKLINNHHYTGGVSFLKQGTPTNNTNETESEFNSSEDNYLESYMLEVRNKNFSDEDPDNLELSEKNKDGYRFANAIGLKQHLNVFQHMKGADETDSLDAENMARALWPVTWDAYLSEDLFGKLSYNVDKEQLKKHFINYVKARGDFSAIRVDDMPYGILPTSAISIWEVANDEEKKEFYKYLSQLLKNLSKIWLNLSDDIDAIPRTGASDDPEKELINILGMQASSCSFHIRNIAEEDYLENLLKFVWPTLFRTENIWNRISNTIQQWRGSTNETNGQTSEPNSFNEFWDQYIQTKEKSAELFNEVTGHPPHIPILNTTTWGDEYKLNVPFIQDGPLSDSLPLENNYIETLLNCNIEEISRNNYPEPLPPSILFMLLREAVLAKKNDWSGDEDPFRESLNHLSKLPTAKLERLTSEILDLSTHRLDAWATSIVTMRLNNLRDIKNIEGIYIGAYGWLEDLEPEPDRLNGGYIHAPSTSHGVTAAVLRNAYLSHADKQNADRMSVNLSSERVNKALWFLEGIRQGQSLNVLLGYRFERSLHETHKNGNRILELDKFISPFRRLYPLNVSKDKEIIESGSVENVSPRNVVDGLTLLKAYKEEEGSQPIPFNSENELPALNSPEHIAIVQEIEDLDEIFDAINDLLLSESVHRAVLGDYLGSGAVLDSVSADGSPPDEFLVSKTPRGGVNIKHHCLVLLPAETTDIDIEKWPATKRSNLSPFLNAWAIKILGDPTKIIGNAEYVKDRKIEKLKFNILGIINPESGDLNTKFGISALDLIYLSSSSLKLESSELEEIITYYIKKEKQPDKDCDIIVNYSRDDSFSADEKSFTEVMPIARTLLKLITNTSYLKPLDLYLPEETEVGGEESHETNFNGFSETDYNWIKEQIKKDEDHGIYFELKGLFENLNNAVNNNEIDQILVNMEQIIQYSIPGAIPFSISEDNDIAVEELKTQAKSVLQGIDKRLKSCIKLLNKAESIKPNESDTDSPDIKNEKWSNAIETLVQCFKEIFGKSFIFLPRFTASNNQELELTFGNQDKLLDNEDECSLLIWLQQAAQTHPNLRQMELLMILSEIRNKESQTLTIGQLPYKENDRWVALPWKDGMDREKEENIQGTLSLVTIRPFQVDFTKNIAGLILDKWDEIIPMEEETTSLVYQYNRPSNESPNTCLLCVSPVVDGNDGKWQWDHLLKCVEETMDMVKIRAVDLDALKKVGRFLPALYMKGKAQLNNTRLKFPFHI